MRGSDMLAGQSLFPLSLGTRLLTATALTAGMLAALPVLSYADGFLSPQVAQSDSSVFDFSITPQTVDAALEAFSNVTDLDVGYRADQTAGKLSPGFDGSASAAEALAALLQGSDLTFRFVGDGVVTLEQRVVQAEDEPIQLGTITVLGKEPIEPFRKPHRASAWSLKSR